MDLAIESVLEQRKEYPPASLTPQDLFYAKVTQVQDIFRVMGDIVENVLKNDIPTGTTNVIVEANTIILVRVFIWETIKRLLWKFGDRLLNNKLNQKFYFYMFILKIVV